MLMVHNENRVRLKIAHLYPRLLNLYGDTGNVITLAKRCEWYGIRTDIVEVDIGDDVPEDADILFIGGGQDFDQEKIESDLKTGCADGKGELIRKLIDAGTPSLAICGGYQLLGDWYEDADGTRINGIGALRIHTVSGKGRLIGDVVCDARIGDIIRIVGFENHGGRTYLDDSASARSFGDVVYGNGNNGEDESEGCVYKNTIGTYLHGPILPRNPEIADWLIMRAVERKLRINEDAGDEAQIRKLLGNTIDDSDAVKAREIKISEILNGRRQ